MLKFVLGAASALVVALIAAVALAPPASALTITTASITFPPATLDGANQTLNGSTSAWRADANGETSGWNVTVASSGFDNGVGNTIPVSNFDIRLLDASIVVVSGDTNGPVSTQTTFGSLSGTARKIASAPVAAGDGIYDLTPDFRLLVPAETYTGNYTATVTITISAGP